jgi:undecaprenyl-diphosphatase
MFLLQVQQKWFPPIDGIDRKIFFLINNRGSNGFLDNLLPFLREAMLWSPLYLFLLVFAVVNFGKKGWWWVLFFGCTAALSDLMSSHLIKENIFRLRPCNDPGLTGRIHILVNYIPQSSSFTSSHATNHFGLAMFIVMTLQRYTTPWIKLFFVWAAAISYAQVYVGVHYPFDVLCGALLGCLLGYITARFFNNYIGLISLHDKSAP